MINIWIDTDPGIDDSVALAVAFKNRDKLNIMGISTVVGNQTIDKVTNNALYLTHLFGADDIPVYRGAESPIARASRPAGHIHGEYGLGPLSPDVKGRKTASECATDALKNTLSSLPDGEKLTVLTIGPLTNIALLLKTYPSLKSRIERLVFMGGTLCPGNVTSLAEYNVWQDPEAAHIVVNSGLELVMCGLDLTMKCFLNGEDINSLNRERPVQEKMYEMLQFYYNSPAYKGKDLVAMHDVCTVLYVLHPELFSGEMHAVDVYLSDDICRGLTYRLDTPYSDYGAKFVPNVMVLNGVKLKDFQNAVMEALWQY